MNYPFRKRFTKGPDDGRFAEAPLLMDCSAAGGDSGWVLPYFSWEVDNDACWSTACFYYEGTHDYQFRHLGNRANVLYLDGHVEAVAHHKDSGRDVWKELWVSDPP